MYARHGGFIEGAEMFDSGFFGMSAAEAKTIVTWQRGLGSRERSRLMCGDLKGSVLYIYI
jgi:hypothetical protein